MSNETQNKSSRTPFCAETQTKIKALWHKGKSVDEIAKAIKSTRDRVWVNLWYLRLPQQRIEENLHVNSGRLSKKH